METYKGRTKERYNNSKHLHSALILIQQINQYMFLGRESQSGRSAADPDAADAIYLSYRDGIF